MSTGTTRPDGWPSRRRRAWPSRTALEALEQERTQAELAHSRNTLANLGRAAAGAAHDLRNELSTALFELDALGAGIQGAEAGLRTSVSSARDLARDFLELEEAPVRRAVDLRQVLRRELSRLPEHAVEAPRDLSDPKPLWVAGRRDLVARIAANLLSNAVQASRRDRAVRIELQRLGARVELAIIDRGRGMDQARLERYLEPGGSRAGTGFGTASVRHCLARIGAELWIGGIAGIWLGGTLADRFGQRVARKAGEDRRRVGGVSQGRPRRRRVHVDHQPGVRDQDRPRTMEDLREPGRSAGPAT